ncbi:MAG: ABC transporter permease [Myxococcota bacterium]
MKLLRHYHLPSLRSRWRTTVATAMGVALVVFVLAASLMLQEGIRRSSGQAGSPDRAVALRRGADNEMGSLISDEDLARISSLPGVARGEAGEPLVAGELVTLKSFAHEGSEGGSNMMLRGTTRASLTLRPEVRVTEGRPPNPGVDEVMVGRAIEGRFDGLTLGGSFELDRGRRVTVVGVFEAGGSVLESEVWGDLEVIRRAFGRPGVVSSVRLRLESPEALEQVQATAAERSGLNVSFQREREFYAQQSEGTALFLGTLGIIIAALASVGAMLGASITMHAAVGSRRREIGVLRALGFTRGAILRGFVLESLTVTLLGGALGSVAALGLGFVQFSVMNVSSLSQVVFEFRPSPSVAITAAVCGALMGLAGGLFPAIVAARTSLATVLRS